MYLVKTTDSELVKIEASLDVSAGITRSQIRSLYTHFDNEFEINLKETFGGFKAKANPKKHESLKLIEDKYNQTGRDMRELEQKVRDVTAKLIPDRKEMIVHFPLGTENWQTAWKITWEIEQFKNDRSLCDLLCIKKAWFKTSPTAGWLQVLGDARVSETFTAYEDDLTSFADMKKGSVGPLVRLEPEHVSPRGFVLKSDPRGRVAVEARDRGVIWVREKADANQVNARRGQEIVLWSCLREDNYFYLMEFGFRDDGSIGFRLGATGRNLPNRVGQVKGKIYPQMTHIHNGCWHVNVDLDGKKQNTVYLARQIKSDKSDGADPQKFKSEELFNGGKEGHGDWVAKEFTELRVKSKVADREIGYDLVPLRYGTSRHYFADSAYTHHDFWVTPYDEKSLRYWYLPTYLQNPARNIKYANVSVWYMASYRHQPRAEDGHSDMHGQPINNESIQGAALTAWMGFDLRPRNVFNKTPLFEE